MTIEEFQQESIAHIEWGWDGEYAAYLRAKFSDRKECAKLFNRCRLIARRNRISVGDARHHLISRGKI